MNGPAGVEVAAPVPVRLFALATGVIVISLYLPQPLVGLLGTTSIQMLVPLAAAMTVEAQRGRVIGNVMSELQLGGMLSRPLASLMAQRFGWRAAYAANVPAHRCHRPARHPAAVLPAASAAGEVGPHGHGGFRQPRRRLSRTPRGP